VPSATADGRREVRRPMHTTVRRLIRPTILALAMLWPAVALAQAFDDDLLVTAHQWTEAFNAGDAAAVAALYHPDATWVSTTGTVYNGLAEIEAFAQAIHDDGVVEVRIEPTDVRRDGPIMYNAGRYTFITANGDEVPGYNLVVSVLEDGEWLILHHLATEVQSDEPDE
jgi:uncharacterized protein (TIGR02246 family)